MESPKVYIPMDRRHALAQGETLPEWAEGSALFADISGFTPLTEALALELGPRRGAEELTRHLNEVYNAVIAELHRYGGSVIGFSGDAITCWLDGDDGRRATACGLAMQEAMGRFASVKTHSGRTVSLGMKAAAATGRVRRFIVGDAGHRIVDVMAGDTMDRMAAAEHHAERGEVVVDEITARNLMPDISIVAWREEEDTGQRFAVVDRLALDVEEMSWLEPDDATYADGRLKGWLLPPVYQRLDKGQGGFLAELRPAVALFLRFSGIDYDHDEEAPQKLGTFVRQVEQALLRFDGSLIQLTLGDKGSYLYAAFGAPIAHEDDVARAASVALDLQSVAARLEYLDPLQIGITTGRMRTGAYGSETRRTYGVLGDAVNLSARLMSAAQPGEILVSDAAYAAAAGAFRWESKPDIKVKGKSELITLWRLVGTKQQSMVRLQEPQYMLPMVGRKNELAFIEEKLDLALSGVGQIVGITGEAGMGKSRLAAEVIRLAGDKAFAGYAGECQSYGTSTGYLVWRDIWSGLFNLDETQPVEECIRRVEVALEKIDPALARRLPLMGTLLNISIPDNELTSSLDPKLRKSSLEAMLVGCLRAWAPERPLLLVLEDCQWLDPLSADLVEVIGRAINDLPVFMLMGYRALSVQESGAHQIDKLAHFAEVDLAEFSDEEAEQLIELKLAQLLGPGTTVPVALLKQVTSKAAGNPYYIEELLNFLRDRGIDPTDTQALAQLDLPSSLYSLVLSRIDQLTERQNATLKVASVIGRLFRAALVWGVYPELGGSERVKANLQVMSTLDLTPMDTPEPELTYLFKHIVIQEVAYESLLYSTRAMLHERIGAHIEENNSDRLEQFLDLLAHHYGRSENEAKKREYFLRAGKAAQAVYDNEAAINYYQQAISLLSEPEKIEVYKDLGEVLLLVGRWDDAKVGYEEAMALALTLNDPEALATYQASMAELTRKMGLPDEAELWLSHARLGFDALGNRGGVAHTLWLSGFFAALRGDWDSARVSWEEGLEIRRELGQNRRISRMLSNLGAAARHKKDFELARALHEEALAIRQELDDPWDIAISLGNLGILANDQGNNEEARQRLQEAAQIFNEVGDRWNFAQAVEQLGKVAVKQGELQDAQNQFQESLLIFRDLGDVRWMAVNFDDLGRLAAQSGEAERALTLVGAAGTMRESVGAALSPDEMSDLDTALAPAREMLSEEKQQQALAAGQAMTLEEALAYALN
jgi:class 3 adenylate cyclase/tetratricopeptide (TPR) repeat protein